MSLPIHACDYAQQPDIHIKCSGKWTTPAVRFRKDAATGIPGVLKDDEGDLYTFDESLVTCTACLTGSSSVLVSSRKPLIDS